MSKTCITLTAALLTVAFIGTGGVRAASPQAKRGPGIHAPRKAKTSRTPAPKVVSAPSSGDTYRPFTDVPPDHWAAAAVETLHRRGIVVGYPDSTR